MCLNRSFAHARAVMNGLLRDVSASRWSLHLSCLTKLPYCAADLLSLL